jgi:hypothetical protein
MQTAITNVTPSFFPVSCNKTTSIEITESWPGVRFTDVGLMFTGCAYATWVKVGRWLGGINNRTRLWIADWIEEGNRQGYRHTYDDLKEITGLEKETLYNYASIGRRVPIGNRVAGNKTSWYAAVAPLPGYDQRKVLRKANEEGWDRDMLRSAVKEIQANKGIEDVPPFPCENLTPALGLAEAKHIMEAARRTMGSIDLAPDSLYEEWEADNIYLNPSWNTDAFIQRLLDWTTFSQAIVLTGNETNEGWCQDLMSEASAICFPSAQRQAIFYLGAHPVHFTDQYLGTGVIWAK